MKISITVFLTIAVFFNLASASLNVPHELIREDREAAQIKREDSISMKMERKAGAMNKYHDMMDTRSYGPRLTPIEQVIEATFGKSDS